MAALVLFGALLVPQELETLVDALRSDKVDERDRAEQELVEFGLAAGPALEKVRRDPDPEVALRAARILLRVEVRHRLSDAVVRRVPDARARLERGETAEWARVFLKAVLPRQDEDRVTDLHPRDLEGLVVPALRHASPDDLPQVCSTAARWGLAVAIPDLVSLLSHEDANARASALSALAVLRATEATTEVARRIADRDDQVREHAFFALRQLRPAFAVPVLRPMLKHEAPRVRIMVLQLLMEAGVKSAAPDAVEALADPDAAVQSQALEALEALGAEVALPQLTKLLESPFPVLRLQAVRVLGRTPSSGPVLAGLLRAEDLTLRQEAMMALARLGWREALPDLLGQLGDPGPRQTVIYALGVLQAKEAVAPLMAFLNDRQLYVRHQAAIALGRIGDPTAVPALRSSLKDSDRRLQLLAADALCRLESAEGVALLLEDAPRHSGGALFALNRLRRPEAWNLLRQRRASLPQGRTIRELLGGLDGTGRVEFSPAFERSAAFSTLLPLGTDAGRDLPLLDALETGSSRFPCVAVLETDRVRILTKEEGVGFWQGWLEKR